VCSQRSGFCRVPHKGSKTIACKGWWLQLSRCGRSALGCLLYSGSSTYGNRAAHSYLPQEGLFICCGSSRIYQIKCCFLVLLVTASCTVAGAGQLGRPSGDFRCLPRCLPELPALYNGAPTEMAALITFLVEYMATRSPLLETSTERLLG
jgi:hypothetical protein